jgi:hypothetical protein
MAVISIINFLAIIKTSVYVFTFLHLPNRI